MNRKIEFVKKNYNPETKTGKELKDIMLRIVSKNESIANFTKNRKPHKG